MSGAGSPQVYVEETLHKWVRPDGTVCGRYSGRQRDGVTIRTRPVERTRTYAAKRVYKIS